MKYPVIVVTLITLLIAAQSCKDIVAENIEGDLPVLLVPYQNDTVDVNPVHFKWEVVEGATKYRLQVVSPSFSSISSYALDTLVTGTEFFQALDSNEYELKLTAVNAGYTSQTLGPIKFWVGISPTYTNNEVVLTSPTNNQYVNASFSGPFSWNSMIDLNSFEFSLREGTNFASGTVVDFQNNISSTSVSLSSGIVLEEGEYTWGVKAYLSSGFETPFSKRTIRVDTTNPNEPLGPFSPFGTMSPTLITFQWSNGSDNGIIKSPVTSYLEISTDSGFASLFEGGAIEVQGNQIVVDMTTADLGTYYWRVINEDEAGNTSVYSATNSFAIN